MTEHIHIEAVGLPADSVKELDAPSLEQGELPFCQHSQKTWTGNTTVLEFYKSGLVKISPPGKKSSPVLIRPGILSKNPSRRYYVPSLFIMLSITAVITSGILYYFSVINEWMLSFSMILAIALIVTQTTYRVTFVTSGGQSRLFDLQSWFIHNKEINEVAALISKMASECELRNAGLPQLVQEHRRLFNEGFILESDYERAKSKIFGKRR